MSEQQTKDFLECGQFYVTFDYFICKLEKEKKFLGLHLGLGSGPASAQKCTMQVWISNDFLAPRKAR